MSKAAGAQALLEILETQTAKNILSKRHLVDISVFKPEEIKTFMHAARVCLGWMQQGCAPMTIFGGNIVGNLFFENSTRTRSSFELAASNLGARVLNLDIDKSSVAKGETLEDTAFTLISMGINILVIRHSENDTALDLSKLVPDEVSIMNAGDGTKGHPTQALLDYFTMLDTVGDMTGKKVVIVGDIKHSRVARSNISLLKKMGVEVTISAPAALLPEKSEIQNMSIVVEENLNKALADADIAMALRIQKERLESEFKLSFEDFEKHYQISHNRLKESTSRAKIMHPGPVNRGVELTDELASDPKISLIRNQVRNGVAVRMAAMSLLFSRRPVLD